MRDIVYNYIQDAKVKGFILSSNLPWEDNGAPIYHHNKKYIYVAPAQTQQSPMMDALDQRGTVDEITTVSVYFVNDAKKLPPEYDNAVEIIKGARLAPGTEGYIQRTCQVTTSFIADALITHFEFSFRKLITN